MYLISSLLVCQIGMPKIAPDDPGPQFWVYSLKEHHFKHKPRFNTGSNILDRNPNQPKEAPSNSQTPNNKIKHFLCERQHLCEPKTVFVWLSGLKLSSSAWSWFSRLFKLYPDWGLSSGF